MQTAEVTLSELAKVAGETATLDTLKEAGLVKKNILFVKVIKSGEINRAITVQGH